MIFEISVFNVSAQLATDYTVEAGSEAEAVEVLAGQLRALPTAELDTHARSTIRGT